LACRHSPNPLSSPAAAALHRPPAREAKTARSILLKRLGSDLVPTRLRGPCEFAEQARRYLLHTVPFRADNVGEPRQVHLPTTARFRFRRRRHFVNIHHTKVKHMIWPWRAIRVLFAVRCQWPGAPSPHDAKQLLGSFAGSRGIEPAAWPHLLVNADGLLLI